MKILQMHLATKNRSPAVGIALWKEYHGRNPDGLKVPPVDLMDCTRPRSYALRRACRFLR
jgi:hypothetical protein